ncbi:hypothetical protein AMJ50_01525 [Parcubacteria bacterium DG_74_3]|nr:MAG: hypothetical protein AMJ50_01525 [Parcubacteria bacterium DG_74_3]
MKFSYNWLKEYLKGKVPKPQKLAELLTLHSFEVEEVEKIGSDFSLDIAVLPNRGPDCLSHVGIARDIAVITGIKFQFPTFKIQEKKDVDAKNFLSLEIRDKNDCPRYTARIVTDLKIASSPKWMQKRLRLLGLRPINNIVDIANYVMLETGQPLHAFDADKITNNKIIVRRAKKGEKIITLDNEKYTLDRKVLLIADPQKPLGIAGIKGGKGSEVTTKTKTIVLESANFNPKVIRRGSQKINLKTDASWRFEHGIDANLTEIAVNRAVALMQQIAEGKVMKGMVDFYPQKVKPRRVRLNLIYLTQLLGSKVDIKEVKNILAKLEFKILQSKPPNLLVEVPTFRLDVNLPEDLIEEIGRMAGLQKIPSIFPQTALIPPQRNLDIFWADFIKNILKEAGFTEVYNPSFISTKEIEILNYKISKLIEIENPTSAEFQFLRPSLIPLLLKNIRENQKYFKDVRIFELGKIFKRRNRKYEEKRMLTGVMTGPSFYQAKGAIDAICNKLGISNVWYDSYEATPEESEFSFWHPKICAEIKTDHEEIGFLGEISSKILEGFEIKNKLIVFDLDFEKLKTLASEEHEYTPISSYPAAIRDISLLVPQETKVIEVLNIIDNIGGHLLRDIDLFDVYKGEEIPGGTKNLSFHLIYQAPDRTLTSREIDKIQQKIIKVLEKNPDWQVRI